jgi:hypothetical protein
MTIARARSRADVSTSVHTSAALSFRRIALWGVLAAKVLAIWGFQWDIEWHVRIGRDSFWIPPHVMMYSGVGAIVVLSFGTLVRDTWRRRRGSLPADGDLAVMGLVGTRGFHLAAWGIALTVLAAPIDDLWHRAFGIDVDLLSPPHLLGLFGSFVNALACVLIAHELYPDGSRMRTAALLAATALPLLGLTLAAQQALLIAYAQGGVAVHLYAIAGTLAFPLPYLIAARLSRLRSAPLLVFVLSTAIGLTGAGIGRVGFDTLQPMALGEAEIARDPTSPIAISRAIGQRPGRLEAAPTELESSIPVLVLVAFDPRRRPAIATVAYGITLLATMTWVLARSPAFAPMLGGAGETLLALALTILAAFASALTARWLAGVLAPRDAGRPAVR